MLDVDDEIIGAFQDWQHLAQVSASITLPFAGKWKGAFVAVKVIDHEEAASKLMALREGALSSSVQHPNVVCSYPKETLK